MIKSDIFSKRKMRNRYSLINKSGLDRLRISIFKSCKHVHLQIIDLNGNVLNEVSTSSKKCDAKTKKDKAVWAGRAMADLIKDKNMKFFYDRGGYVYHGIVKVCADVMRENGVIL